MFRLFHKFIAGGSAVWLGALLLAIPSGATSLLSIAWNLDGGAADLVSIDSTTFAVTDIGSLGVSFQYGGLAYDSANNTLYMVDGRGGTMSLYTVNPSTGAATLVGSHGLTDLFGLTFDSANSTLYGSQFISGTPLETFNTSTGAVTPVGTSLSPTERIGALAFDTSNSTLYGLEDCLGCAKLFTINPTTGVATLLQGTGLDTNNSGMVYDPSLNRLWDVDVDNRLSYFDPVTGAQTQVAVLTSPFGELSGLALVPGISTVPEPTSVTLVGAGLALLWLRKRRVRRFTD